MFNVLVIVAVRFLSDNFHIVCNDFSPWCLVTPYYRDADKSLARPTYQCILFDGGDILFDASLFLYI